MSDLDKLVRLNELFIQMRDALIKEHEDNWIRGINSILNQINYSLENNENIKDTIKSIGNTYSFMNNGNGSFSDFYIWREDFDERVIENNKFIEIKDEIGSLIANQ